MSEQPFQEISIDFITGFPPSQGADGETYDAILVIVDRFTKMGLFIPTIKTLNAASMASLLYKHVECRFGSPLGIVSDRDKLFTSEFWKEFTKTRGILRRLSTAFHPQTDGQTERLHQTIEKILRIHALEGDPLLWSRKLPEAEFTYNNSTHATTGVSSFEALYGYHPRMVEYVEGRNPIKVQGVKERLQRLEQVRKAMRRHWAQAVEAQKKGYNKRHTPIEFRPGDIVGLSTKNFRFKNRKLTLTYIKVKIPKRIGSQAYQVILPTQYSRMHDVFPVSLLEL